jgi:pimeloyl-ACP methyl ester carboxylesterase
VTQLSFFTTPDGTSLFYTDVGLGRPILLLHGWACDGNDWAWQAPELEHRYRVITVDHRGHGRSAAPLGSYQPQVLADDAAALLTTLAPGQAAFVFGHSMGTVVASALAVRHPEVVSGLVLVDPVYNVPDDATKVALGAMSGADPAERAAEMFDAAFYTPDTPPFLKTWHRRRVLGTPGHVVAGCLLGLYQGDEGIGRAVVARDYLQKRKTPRLAVYASEPAAWLENTLPLGELDEIKVISGGHFLHQQKPDEFNHLALDWLLRFP